MRRIAIAAFLLAALDTTAGQLVIRPGITLDVPRAWKARRDTATTWLLERRIAGRIEATMIVRVEGRRSHAEAVRRLAEIDAEYEPRAEFRLHQGWPAIERKFRAPLAPPDHGHPNERYRADDAWRATTAVAAGVSLVRLHTVVAPDADAKLADEGLRIGRLLNVPRGPDGVVTMPARLRPKEPRAYATRTTTRQAAGGAAPMMVNGQGEIEAAISMDGQRILTVANCSMSYSTNGGSSFTNPQTDSAKAVDDDLSGDCSIAWGPSGRFYRSTLGRQVVALFRSTEPVTNSFPYVARAVDRRRENINVDQPHIAADRWNMARGGGDRVYVVWQEAPKGASQWPSRIACSSDSGATWGPPVDADSGDTSYPRVAVGADGMVYVVSRAGANINIAKFSDCDAGLAPQSGFPVAITISDVTCPIPGLDRCNNGNALSSPTIAVDDLRPSNVYLGYAQTNREGGQDVLVAQSTDGGLTFHDPVALNGRVTAKRFMPWLGAWNGVVYAGWYDRRAATEADNDLTSYYMNSVSVVNGTLTPGPEVDLSGVADPQCASGWSCGARSPDDATSCCRQPQLAGYCGTDDLCSARCDFSNPQCTGGAPCVTGSGCPKYGDYNGLAVSGGTLVNVWATATPPSTAAKLSRTGVQAWTVITQLPQPHATP